MRRHVRPSRRHYAAWREYAYMLSAWRHIARARGHTGRAADEFFGVGFRHRSTALKCDTPFEFSSVLHRLSQARAWQAIVEHNHEVLRFISMPTLKLLHAPARPAAAARSGAAAGTRRRRGRIDIVPRRPRATIISKSRPPGIEHAR